MLELAGKHREWTSITDVIRDVLALHVALITAVGTRFLHFFAYLDMLFDVLPGKYRATLLRARYVQTEGNAIATVVLLHMAAAH